VPRQLILLFFHFPMCLDSWYCCSSIQSVEYRASLVIMGRMAVPRLRQSAAVLSPLRLGFSSRLVNVGLLTKWHWHRLLPENFRVPLPVSAHQSSIIISHRLVPTECPFRILPYDRSLKSSKASSQHDAFSFSFQHLLFTLTTSSCSLRLLPRLPITYILPHIFLQERLLEDISYAGRNHSC